MSEQPLRVAIVGTGSMGRAHAEACRDLPNGRVVAVVGRNQERAAAVAAPLGATPYTDLEIMLDQSAVDVLDCCLPTPLHRPTVEMAVAHGCHVICEKPLALTAEDGAAMIAACRTAGRHLLVAHVLRFFPEYRRLAGAVHEGAIGVPASACLLRQGFYPSGSDDWFHDERKSGGIFLDLMIHDLDWVLWQFGPVERVHARLVQCMTPRRFAQGMATVRHRSGVLSQITGTWGHPGPFTTAVEVAGSGGLLRHQSQETQPLSLLSATPAAEVGGVALPDLSVGENGFRTQLGHFLEVVAGRAEPLVRAEEALAALRLALAARLSARSGRPVLMEEEQA